MTEQQTPTPADQELTWGGQQPPRTQRWSGKKTAAAVAIAVAVAAAGGVAVYAASGTAGTATQQGAGGPGGGGFGGMRGGGQGGAGGVMDALHGEFTVSDGNGGYKTEIMQTGQVTAISDTSLTAKSTDGYTKVYTIATSTTFGTGTVSDIKSGDTVTVVATPVSDKATADSVLDRAQMPQGGQGAPAAPPGGGR